MISTSQIGFIGTGVMGRSMAGHLIKAGHQLTVFNRTRSKAEFLLEMGARWGGEPRDLARSCGLIITMVGYPKDVEEIYLGKGGLIANAHPGSLFIDMTTSSPDLAKRIASAALEAGSDALDAPVSGGDYGAREALLSIMVGGRAESFDKARPVLACMGKTLVHQGPAGSGQHCKMANQIAIASGMMAICESMAYARKAGLDPETVLQSIGSGAAGSWSLNNLAPRMLKGDYDPGFYVKHFIKDLKIALDSARAMEVALPGMELALELYERLAGQGYAEEGTQALFRLYS